MKDWDLVYKNWDKNMLPNTLLTHFFHLAPKGRALDIACGVGQNSLFLAQKGFIVECFDKSKEAIKLVPKHPLIFPKVSDSKKFEFGKYELIVCVNFLDRDLFKKIISSLTFQGVLIMELFNSKINPAYCVDKGELCRAFGELEILYYEALDHKSKLVAKKHY